MVSHPIQLLALRVLGASLGNLEISLQVRFGHVAATDYTVGNEVLSTH